MKLGFGLYLRNFVGVNGNLSCPKITPTKFKPIKQTPTFALTFR